jgi:hypothetical protein
LHAFLILTMRAACSADLILPDLMTNDVFQEVKIMKLLIM